MRSSGNRVRFLTAAGVLVVGAGWAGNLALAPTRYQGPDTRQLRELAARLREEPAAAEATMLALPESKPAGRAGEQDGSVTVETRRREGSGAEAEQAPVGSKAHAGAAAAPAAPATPAPVESPVKNIALMGVTSRGSTEQAWLVDLNSGERETVAEGEPVFGFTLKDIDTESVVLAKGDDEYTLHLGEKPIASASADSPAAAANRTPTSAPDGSSDPRAEFRRRFEAMRSAMSSPQSSFNSSSSGGWSGGGDSRRWSSSSSPVNTAALSAALPYMFSGGGRRGSNQGVAFGPTSNPQTARRRGGQLVGEAAPVPEPEPLSNPQTMRRLGSTTGPAFGDSSYSQRSGSRNGATSRTGR